DLRQGRVPARHDPQGGGGQDLPHLHEVIPEDLPMAVRNDERRGGLAAAPDQEGLSALLRRQLLGDRDAGVMPSVSQPSGRDPETDQPEEADPPPIPPPPVPPPPP